MLDAKDYPPGSAIYSFVERETGANIHIDSEKLRQWCRAHRHSLDVELSPVSDTIAVSFLTDNVISLEHLKKVASMEQLDPIIYGKVGSYTNGAPDVILIDGHHRYFLAFVFKSEVVPAYLLEPEQWQPFQIIGLPDHTEEQLRAAPVAKGGGK